MNLRKTRRKRYWQKRNMRECGKLFQRHSHKLHSTGTCKYTANRAIRGKDERQLHTVRGAADTNMVLKSFSQRRTFSFQSFICHCCRSHHLALQFLACVWCTRSRVLGNNNNRVVQCCQPPRTDDYRKLRCMRVANQDACSTQWKWDETPLINFHILIISQSVGL